MIRLFSKTHCTLQQQRRSAHKRSLSSMAGMTLMEIVIAVGILGFIMSIAYRALSQITISKEILDDERDASMIANAVLGRITRELSLAVPIRLLPQQSEDGDTTFSGEVLRGENATISAGNSGDSITFMARNAGQYVPDGRANSGVVQITYRAEPDPEPSGDEEPLAFLVRDEIPDIRPLKTAYESRMTFPVTNRLVRLKFRYYDAREEEWSQDWTDDVARVLPDIVKLNVQIKSRKGRIFNYTTLIKVGQRFENQ